MRIRRSGVIALIATTGFLLGLAGLWQAYFTGGPLPSGAGMQIGSPADTGTASARDMPPEEAGRFAGPQFTSARRHHQENRARYLQLEFDGLPTARSNISLRVHPKLQAPVARVARAADHEQASRSLADALATVLLRSAGADNEQYLQMLPAEAQLRAPHNANRVRLVYQEYLRQRAPNLENPSPADLRKSFEDMSRVMVRHDDGAVLANGWTLSRNGFAIAVAWLADESERRDLLLSTIPAEQFGYWYGSLAEGSVIFHGSPESWEEHIRRDGGILFAHAAFILRSRSGDAYPLQVRMWYDRVRGVWWLDEVSRRSSIQVGNAPPLAF